MESGRERKSHKRWMGGEILRYTVVALAFVLFGLALAACSGPSQSSEDSAGAADVGQVVPVEGGGQYVDILPQELEAMLVSKDFTFVNVHIPYEGEIENTDLFIPFDEIERHLEELPSPDSRIVLYCRSGSMSAIAARMLVSAGYTNVFNLDGGFRAWEAVGYPLLMR